MGQSKLIFCFDGKCSPALRDAANLIELVSEIKFCYISQGCALAKPAVNSYDKEDAE